MSLLRKIYYSIPPRARYVVRKMAYWPKDIMSKRQAMVPPKGLIYTGSGDFLKAGKDWATFFYQNGLQVNGSILDIGSGIGRIAVGLTDQFKGRYEGFEAMEVGVDWCKKHITTRFSNFHFQHIHLYNDLYNDKGIDASGFDFPYDDHCFDFACAISVFSHMIDTEVDNYLKECSRVLKPGGILVATFFILHRGMEQANPSFSFNYYRGHYSLMDEKVVSANVAFDYDWLLSCAGKHGFVVEKYIRGYWSGYDQKERLAFQDVLVLKLK